MESKATEVQGRLSQLGRPRDSFEEEGASYGNLCEEGHMAA